MNVVLVTPYLPPVPGGIERDLLQLANQFAYQGDVVAIVTTPQQFPIGRIDLDQPLTYELPPGLPVVRLEGHLRTRLRNFHPANPSLWLPGLASTVLRSEPDVVIVYNIGWPLTVLPALLALRRRTVVLYRTAYHAYEDRHPLDPARRRLKLAVAGLSHRLLTFSHFEKEQIIRDGGLPASRIVPIYPGVEIVDLAKEDVAAFRTRYDLAGKVVVSHVARLSAFKGTARLIRILPEVRRWTGRDVVLLLVGRNLEKDELDEVVRDLDVGAYVRFTGPLSERELHLAYAASDLFALPSQYESFGFVFLEAMTHGVPVVGVGTGGVPEVIRDGETGFVLDSHDDLEGLTERLVRLVVDEPLCARLGEQARAWTRERFNWVASAEAVKSVVRQVSLSS